MSSLGNRERRFLLEVARGALTCGVERHEFLADVPGEGVLREPGGAFVTIRKRNRLRGCIGQLPSVEPLMDVIAHCAMAVAREDPRFDPVRLDELSDIEIELSVLSPPAPITLELITPGKHGLLVTRGCQRGVLLPQVAVEHHWTAERFLEETCVKAVLERDAWKDRATKIEAFTADVFSESSLQIDEIAGPSPEQR
ncbi:MAG: AmmeMemoRadiSam system protein A [Candidatus Acidiferrales bacterium]